MYHLNVFAVVNYINCPVKQLPSLLKKNPITRVSNPKLSVENINYNLLFKFFTTTCYMLCLPTGNGMNYLKQKYEIKPLTFSQFLILIMRNKSLIFK